MEQVIGREKELNLLDKLHFSKKSEFVAVYGRRRVGKTFLIRSAFENKFTFQITGLANVSNKQQLTNFNLALHSHQKTDKPILADDWISSFALLIEFLKTKKGKKRDKIGTFRQETSTKKSVLLSMLTTYGVLENKHSIGLIQNDITMDSLFKKKE